MNAKRFAFAEERAKLFNNKKLIFIKNEIKKYLHAILNYRKL
jgi:hypothetical protein